MGDASPPPRPPLTRRMLSRFSLSTSREPDTRSCSGNRGISRELPVPSRASQCPSRWESVFGAAQTPPPPPRGWEMGVTKGSGPTSARIPLSPLDKEEMEAKHVPAYQEPQPEEDPAGHGQGRFPVL